MYVIARHRIKDPERFFTVAQAAAEKAPDDVYGRQFCPSRDRTQAVCLWEAELTRNCGELPRLADRRLR